MKRLLTLIALALICLVTQAVGQSTFVTLQATDSDGQTWNNGTWTATLYSPPGVPAGNYVIAGSNTPVPNQQQNGSLNSSGGSSLTVTPNLSIFPSGTQWQFQFCPLATPAACIQFALAVNGATQTVQPVLPAIRISVSSPVVRATAYTDTEVTGGSPGSLYFNLSDLTMHVCNGIVSPCTTWSSIGGGGSGSPGGLPTQVQFNDGGTFNGNPLFTFNKTVGANPVVNIGLTQSLIDPDIRQPGTLTVANSVSGSLYIPAITGTSQGDGSAQIHGVAGLVKINATADSTHFQSGVLGQCQIQSSANLSNERCIGVLNVVGADAGAGTGIILIGSDSFGPVIPAGANVSDAIGYTAELNFGTYAGNLGNLRGIEIDGPTSAYSTGPYRAIWILSTGNSEGTVSYGLYVGGSEFTRSTDYGIYSVDAKTFLGGVVQLGATDLGLSRDAGGILDVGNGTASSKAAQVNAAIFNAGTGFQIAGAAPLNHCLIGNGTDYVDSTSCGGGGGGTITGSGTNNTLTMFTGTSSIGNSPISYSGTTLSTTAKWQFGIVSNGAAFNALSTYSAGQCAGSGSGFSPNGICPSSRTLDNYATDSTGLIAGFIAAISPVSALSSAPSVTALYGWNDLNANGSPTWQVGTTGAASLSGASGTVANFGGVFGGAYLGLNVTTGQKATLAWGVAGLISNQATSNTQPFGASLMAYSPSLVSPVSHIYGLYIQDQTVGGGTDNPDPWGIYVVGTAPNKIGGNTEFLNNVQIDGTCTGCGGGGSMTWPASAGLAVYSGSSSWSASVTPNATTVPQAVISASGSFSLAYPGVPVDATNTTPLPVIDRGSYLNWTSGTALALPAITGAFASNFPFVIQVTSGSTLVVTPNAAAGDLCDGASTCSLLNNTVTFVYQNSTSAPGHWLTARLQTIAGMGGNCTNGLIWSTTTGAGCLSGAPITLAETDGNIIFGSGGVWTKGTALPNGITATTQSQLDGTAKVATDLYVDTAVSNAIAAVNPAIAVLAASTANLTGTYANGASGIGATFTVTATGAFTLDGVSISTIGQRVLLKNQTTAFQNGAYTATVVGTTGVSPVFTRALDYDQPSDINTTGAIPVQSGTANASTSWLLTSTVTTVGTDALTFTQFSLNPVNLVTAVSPGAGICHFAGSTQNCTSSLIVAADITSNTITGTQLASSLALVTPNIGAATGTSLLASGTVDGKAPITITTGTTATLGAATYQSGYTFNQEATAGTAVTYTLPATAAGLQYCVRNSIVSGTGAANTGVLTVYPPASSYVILNGVRNTIGGGGTHGVASAGAAGDSACFVAIDATDWEVYAQRGTWTAN